MVDGNWRRWMETVQGPTYLISKEHSQKSTLVFDLRSKHRNCSCTLAKYRVLVTVWYYATKLPLPLTNSGLGIISSTHSWNYFNKTLKTRYSRNFRPAKKSAVRYVQVYVQGIKYPTALHPDSFLLLLNSIQPGATKGKPLVRAIIRSQFPVDLLQGLVVGSIIRNAGQAAGYSLLVFLHLVPCFCTFFRSVPNWNEVS